MIAASDLGLEIDGRIILDGMSFAVARGEAVALVGPNGSGKTSVLRCLLGLVPFAGSATIGGHDVVREPVAARRLVGYVPQKAAFGDARAAEALVFVARLRGVDPGRATALLAAVGLEAHAGERVRTFSGGMQQRLALAVALVGDPPVLLLDEPTASLDQEGQAMFLELAAKLRGRERTLLLASHRTDEVAALADRVLHVDRGRLVAAPERGARVIPMAPWRERR
ncbi:MAG: ABC transporter ATP-binding protein [Candidatus Binatia bacterium]